MSEQPTLPQPGGGKSKGMPILAAIAGVLVISYTVWRLQYAANHLPYDPGQPYPALDVAAEPATDLATRVRDVVLGHHSARVSADGRTTDYRAWPLFGLERERAFRRLDEWLEAARKVPAAQRTTATATELALHVAAHKLVHGERCFVIEHELPQPAAADGWVYWTHLLFEAKERQRFLCVAIDNTEFPFVAAAKTADPATFDPR